MVRCHAAADKSSSFRTAGRHHAAADTLNQVVEVLDLLVAAGLCILILLLHSAMFHILHVDVGT